MINCRRVPEDLSTRHATIDLVDIFFLPHHILIERETLYLHWRSCCCIIYVLFGAQLPMPMPGLQLLGLLNGIIQTDKTCTTGVKIPFGLVRAKAGVCKHLPCG